MERNFTTDEKERLKKICEIKKSKYDFDLIDAISDTFLWIQKSIGFLDISNYVGDVNEYHRKIIDMRNYEAGQIDQIFAEVGFIDAETAENFNELKSNIDLIIQKIQALQSCIQPSSHSFTTAGIIEANLDVNKELTDSCKKMESIYDAELSYAESQALKDGVVKSLKSVLGSAVDIFTLIPRLATALMRGGVVGLYAEGASCVWDLMDDVVSVSQHLEGLILTGAAIGFGAVGMNSVRSTCLAEGQDVLSRDGLVDELEAEGYKEIAEFASRVETTNNLYKTYTSARDIKDGIFDNDFKKDYLKKYPELKKYFEELDQNKNVAKLTKTTVDILGADNYEDFQDKVRNDILDYTEGLKPVKDAVDIVKDARDVVEDIMQQNPKVYDYIAKNGTNRFALVN